MKNLITCLVVTLLSGAVSADTWTVDDDGKADFDNIQAAIDAASDGDEIIVMPGTYTNTNEFVVLIEGKDLSIRSKSGSELTVIDGNNAHGCILYQRLGSNNPALGSIEGFTITGGNAGEGGGIRFEGSSPQIINCIIVNNTASAGGGIFSDYYYSDSNPSFVDCLIKDNIATGSGGGVQLDGSSSTASFFNCEIIGNVAGGNGGGFFCANSEATISSCVFQNNIAKNKGGGIYTTTNDAPTIGACIFSANTALSGGAVYCNDVAYIGSTKICKNSEPQIIGNWSDSGQNEISEFCDGGACCTNNQALCVMTTEGECLKFGGTFTAYGTNCTENPCPTSCLGDVTGDGQVDVSDLLVVIGVWGACP